MIKILGSIIVGFSLILLAIALGKKILTMFSYAQRITEQECFIFGGGIGIGSMGTILFFLGIFHLYYKSIVLAILLFAGLFLYKEIRWALKAGSAFGKELFSVKKQKIIIMFCKIMLGIFIIGNFFSSLTPEVQWDSLVYHLTTAKIYTQYHGIKEIPYDYHTYMPKQFDILFVIGEILDLEQTGKIITYMVNLLLVAALFYFCKRRWDEEKGILAATIFYTIPTISIYQPTTYNDLPTTFFLFLACMAFFKIQEEKKWIYLAGFFLGCASATKIVMISFFVFFSGALFFIMRRPGQKRWMKKYFSMLILLLLVGTAVVVPWLTVTYLQTGNPVYPFFYGIFGGKYWNEELDQWWSNLREDYGNGRTWTAYLTAPWFLTMYPMRYGPVYGFSPFFLIFLPLFFVIRNKTEEQKRVCWFFLFFLLFFSGVWFLLASDARYLFPIIPGATVLVIATVKRLEERRNIYKIIIAGLLFLVLFSNMLLFGVINRETMPVILGLKNKEEYLQEKVQNYELAQWININVEETAVLFIANDDRTYFFEREYIKGYPIIQGYIDYTKIATEEEFYTLLKKKNVTHVIVTEHNTEEGMTLTIFKGYYNEKITMLWQDLVKKHGQLLEEKNNVFLYKLT